MADLFEADPLLDGHRQVPTSHEQTLARESKPSEAPRMQEEEDTGQPRSRADSAMYGTFDSYLHMRNSPSEGKWIGQDEGFNCIENDRWTVSRQ